VYHPLIVLEKGITTNLDKSLWKYNDWDINIQLTYMVGTKACSNFIMADLFFLRVPHSNFNKTA